VRTVVALDHRLAGTKFVTALLTGFALVAAFLAMLGIYGVTAYALQQRQKEVAIRVALGASQRALMHVFLSDGALLLAIGIAAGLAGGAAASRVLRHQVYGLEGFGIAIYVASCAVLLAVGLAASWWPLRRVAATDTIRALNAN
jgi:ABC-type antimicrobial peptide transport system permease subunit